MSLRPMFVAAICMLCVRATVAAEDPSIAQARALGERVQHALVQGGKNLSSVEMSQLRKELDDANASSSPGTAAALKLQSVDRAFAVLARVSTNVDPNLRPDLHDTTRVTKEIVSVNHGTECSNALGLDTTQPTQLTLAQGHAVWLYVGAPGSGTLRIATSSYGPDPAIDVFDGCGSNAQRLGGNDDSIGLDAVANIDTTAAKRVYVRLVNNGEAGLVSVTAGGAPGSINGTVRDGKTNRPIAGLQVSAYSAPNFYFSGGVDHYRCQRRLLVGSQCTGRLLRIFLGRIRLLAAAVSQWILRIPVLLLQPQHV